MLNANQRFNKGEVLVRDFEASSGIINCIFYCPIDETVDGVETEWDNETESEIPIHTFTDVVTSEDVKWGLHMFITATKFFEQYDGYRYLEKCYGFIEKAKKVSNGECSDMDIIVPISRMRVINSIIDYARAFQEMVNSEGFINKIPDDETRMAVSAVVSTMAKLDKFDLPSIEAMAIGRANYNKKIRDQGAYI